MFYLNRVMLAGRVLSPPEVRYTRQGKAVVMFSVRTPVDLPFHLEGFQGEVEVKVVAFGPQGERWAEGVRVGDNVFVEGDLSQRVWEGEAFLKREMIVVARRITLIKGGRDGKPEKGL